MKSKISFYADNVLYILSIFLVVFVWTRHYTHNKIIIVSVTFLLTMILSFFVVLFSHKKRENTIKSNTLKQEIKKLEDALLFMPLKDVLNFLADKLSQFRPTIKKYFVIIEKDFIQYIILPKIKYKSLTCQDYIDIYKRYNNFENIIVFGISEEVDCRQLRESLSKNIYFVSVNDFYVKFISSPLTLLTPYKAKKKKKFVDILQMFLSKKMSKKYLILTMLFSVYAFLFRYTIYYAVCSLITLILAIVSFKNKKFNSIERSFI